MLRHPHTLAHLLDGRIAAGAASALEVSLAEHAGTESASKWLGRAAVAASPGIGWVAGGGGVRVRVGVDGLALPGQSIRLVHRASRLPCHDILDAFEDGGLLPSAALGESLVVPVPERLVFIDVDHVLVGRLPRLHAAAGLAHEHLPMALIRRAADASRLAHGLVGAAGSVWADEALLAHLTAGDDEAHAQRVFRERRYPVTLYAWRQRLLQCPGSLGAMERLLALQQRYQEGGVGFVMNTTHLGWLDAAAFRDVLLYPLNVVGAVWPRHVGGIVDWVARFAAAAHARCRVAFLDDRSDFYGASVLRPAFPSLLVRNRTSIANALVQVPRRIPPHRHHSHQFDVARYVALGDGEEPLVQQRDTDAVEALLELPRPCGTALAFAESLYAW